jgi:type II secretion system protein I
MEVRKPRTRRAGLQDNATGFTLLEVLVATAILGTAVAALLSLLSGSLRNAARLEPPQRALALAEGQLNDLLVESERGRNSDVLPLDQKVEGRWDERYRWEALATRVRAADLPSPNLPILVRVDFDVFWKDGPGDAEKQLTLETSELWQQVAGGTR